MMDLSKLERPDPAVESRTHFLAGIYPNFSFRLFFGVVRLAREHNPLYRRVWRSIRLWVLLFAVLFVAARVEQMRVVYRIMAITAQSEDKAAAEIAAVMSMTGRVSIVAVAMIIHGALHLFAPFAYAAWAYRRFYLRNQELQVLPLTRPQLCQGIVLPGLVAVIILFAVQILVMFGMMIYIVIVHPELANEKFSTSVTGVLDLIAQIIGLAWANFIAVFVYPFFFVTYVLRTLLIRPVSRHHHSLAASEMVRSLVIFFLMLGTWGTLEFIALERDSFGILILVMLMGFFAVFFYFRMLWRADAERADVVLFKMKEGDE